MRTYLAPLYFGGGAVLLTLLLIISYSIFPAARPILTVIYLFFILTGFGTLMAWHNKNYGYRCQRCGEFYEIGYLRNFITPQFNRPARKYLRCSHCRRFSAGHLIPIERKDIED